MHLPWNQYHVGPAKIVHGGNGGNSVDADSGRAITMATAVAVVAVNDGGDSDSHDGGVPARQATIS